MRTQKHKKKDVDTLEVLQTPSLSSNNCAPKCWNKEEHSNKEQSHGCFLNVLVHLLFYSCNMFNCVLDKGLIT